MLVALGWTAVLEGESIRGAALDTAAGRLWSWGDTLREWDAQMLESRVVVRGPFGEGGCTTDMNRDGREDLVLVEGTGTLVWLEAPEWKRHVLDSEAAMHDCLGAELFGEAGVLVVHRFMQVRFYTTAGVRDIYSFYTASDQAGLLTADVDVDGRKDIVSGNYWIRSPESADLPWRLFAINTIHEEQKSATFRMAWLEDGNALVVAQGELRDGRVLLFRKPGNPREQWPAVRLGEALGLRFPHALVVADVDGDGDRDIVVGENNGGASRLFLLRSRGGEFVPEQIGSGFPALAAWHWPAGQVTVVGPHGVRQLAASRD
jgi:hypothetical protein